MDVRCEQCGTEYELDESRLKPGGVTVKCTSCGHMFKIRKRTTTNVGLAPHPPTTGITQPPPRPDQAAARGLAAGAQSNAVPRTRMPTENSAGIQAGSGPAGDRNWIIRLANGEQRTCRELATLQQWIVAGEATRESMISRSGKTWKQLGDIPELAQFFEVADEARDERMRRESARHATATTTRTKPQTPAQTLLGVPSGMPPRPAPPSQSAPRGTSPPPRASSPPPRPVTAPPPRTTPPHGSVPHPSAQHSTAPHASAPPPKVLGGPPAASNDGDVPTLPRGKVAPPPAAPITSPPPMPSLAQGKTVPIDPAALAKTQLDPAARSTGAWAATGARDVKQFAEEQPVVGRAGPEAGRVKLASGGGGEPAFGGLGTLKSVPTDDVAFASSIGRRGGLGGLPAPEEYPSAFDEDSTGPVVTRSVGGGLGKWIAVGSLIVIAGAALAIYVLVIRGDSKAQEAATPSAALDAAVVVTALDAGQGMTPPPPVADDVIAAAHDGLRGDTVPALEAAAARLADGASAEDPERLALRARIATAIVQDLEDEAAFTGDAKAAEKLRAGAKKRLPDAAALAQKALKKAAGTPAEALANVAMADVLRLQGKGAKDVKKSLDRALTLAAGDREATLVSALLAAREGRAAEAQTALQQLDTGANALEQSGDVRPRFRLAALAFAAGDKEGAQKAAEAVIAAQADHAGARALLARLRDAVATSDPMPPEEGGAGKGPGATSTSGTSGGTKPGGSEPRGDDYDALLAKADSLAENNCADALPLYKKALAAKPNGVAALTGIGYCYVDAKQFSSAHSSFRAALAVSRRYEPALWGVAEAYQQQGLKDKAIEAYMDYLEAYPGTQKAIKQIERLGGSADGSGGGGTGGSTEPKPDEPKPDEPKPQDPPPTPPSEPAPTPSN